MCLLENNVIADNFTKLLGNTILCIKSKLSIESSQLLARFITIDIISKSVVTFSEDRKFIMLLGNERNTYFNN